MNRASLLLCLCLPGLLLADQVTLKNGDKLSGTIVKYDGKNLVLKSELAGAVTIAWDSVTGIVSTAPLNVGLKDGQTVVGTVTMAADGKIQVITLDAGTVTAARDTIVYLRSKEEQAAYDADLDHSRNPRLVDLWTGFLDLNFAQSQGNADTKTFTLNSNASRATTRDKTAVYYTQIFSSSNASGKNLTTASAKRGGLAYNLNFDKRWFAFGSVDLENDQFQDLDLRFSPAGGGGAHLIKSEKTQFDAMLGASLNREFFSTGLHRTSGEILLGEEIARKLFANSSFHEKLVFYPNVSDSGNYRMNFDTSLVTAVRKWLGWQVSVSDRYLSNPVVGRKKNDVLFTTGVRLTFTK
jgi:putative salt-induced outer membrane protein YdiY